MVLLFVFLPVLVSASTAGDFTVNNQPTYDIPYNTTKVLILDLTLPEPPAGESFQVESIKIHSAGTADHTVITELMIWEDGSSPGWDNDEMEVGRVLQAPFFDTEISGNFKAYSKDSPWQRIFVTVDILDTASILERILQLQLLKNSVVFTTSAAIGPTDAEIIGFERKIRYNAPVPTAPVSPLAKSGEALLPTTLRWHFTDLSNNEFGFKILDSNSKEVARNEEADISYIDETGLQPNTKYSGRRVNAFNDRGESLSSALSIFPAVQTLSLPPAVEETPVEETPVEAIPEEVVEEKPVAEMTVDEIKAKIVELQQRVIELLNQLIQLLLQQIAAL